MIFTTTVYSIIKIRFGLADHRREGASITLSPDGRLAASTDEFGRIMLMSMKDRIVLRSWKGWLFVIIYYTRLCPKWTNYSIIFFYYVKGFFSSQDIVMPSVPGYQYRRNIMIIIPSLRILDVLRCSLSFMLQGEGFLKWENSVTIFENFYSFYYNVLSLKVWTSEHGPRAAAFNVGRNNKWVLLSTNITLIYCVLGVIASTWHHVHGWNTGARFTFTFPVFLSYGNDGNESVNKRWIHS